MNAYGYEFSDTKELAELLRKDGFCGLESSEDDCHCDLDYLIPCDGINEDICKLRRCAQCRADEVAG